MNQLKRKLANYPDWDRDEQIKRNRLALDILERRRQKRLQLTDAQEKERTEFFEEFKELMDDFRPLGSKLYSQE
jgi:hypothetical protein